MVQQKKQLKVAGEKRVAVGINVLRRCEREEENQERRRIDKEMIREFEAKWVVAATGQRKVAREKNKAKVEAVGCRNTNQSPGKVDKGDSVAIWERTDNEHLNIDPVKRCIIVPSRRKPTRLGR